VTRIATRMKRLLPACLAALVLGGAALISAVPAQAQYGYHDGYRPRVERRIVERRIGRPVVERRVIVRRPFVRNCRVVVTRRINHFGERVVVRRRVCH
jgi:hypothetical protein